MRSLDPNSETLPERFAAVEGIRPSAQALRYISLVLENRTLTAIPHAIHHAPGKNHQLARYGGLPSRRFFLRAHPFERRTGEFV
jgi:hypothetical protein